MANIKIVTDSTADIPQDVREKYGIEMVPLKVHFGEDTFLDAVNIHPEEFYNKLSQAENLPTTSQPSPVEFLDLYKKLAAEDPNTEIISIHISSALSGTYQSAVLAKSLLEEKINITIIDSKSASYGLGVLAVSAANAANEGKSLEECQQMIHSLRSQTQLYFLVDTLEYLKKGGRIGKASAVLGSLLNIKPILSLDSGGEVYSVDKVRGQNKAMHRILELLKKDFKDDIEVNVCIAHSQALATGEELSALVKKEFQVKELTYTELGPSIGTHVGPGTVAVFVSLA